MKKRTRKNTRPSPEHLSADGLRAFELLIKQGVAALARVGAELAVKGLEDRVACGRLRILDRWTLEALVEEAGTHKERGYAEAARFIAGLIPPEVHHPRRT